MNATKTEDQADRSELWGIRKGLGLTQAQMAQAMGVPFRTYQDLEGGVTATRQVHVNAALWAAVSHAADGRDGTYPSTVTNAVVLAYRHLLDRGAVQQ